jgi:hypothetical protein
VAAKQDSTTAVSAAAAAPHAAAAAGGDDKSAQQKAELANLVFFSSFFSAALSSCVARANGHFFAARQKLCLSFLSHSLYSLALSLSLARPLTLTVQAGEQTG